MAAPRKFSDEQLLIVVESLGPNATAGNIAAAFGVTPQGVVARLDRLAMQPHPWIDNISPTFIHPTLRGSQIFRVTTVGFVHLLRTVHDDLMKGA